MAWDYLAMIDAAFNQWFKFMVQYVNEKCSGTAPAWTHIPQAVLTAIADVYAAWYTAYAVPKSALRGGFGHWSLPSANSTRPPLAAGSGHSAIHGARRAAAGMPLFEAKPEGLCPALAWSFCEAKTPMPKIGREADFWQAMGIPNHDTHPSPIPVPGDIPEVDVRTPLPRVLRFFPPGGHETVGCSKRLSRFEPGVCFANSTN
jgi:hypothetical protein